MTLVERLRSGTYVDRPDLGENIGQYTPPTAKELEAADRIEALEAALKPFGEYLNEMPDLDNKGNPLPDDQGMGWVYLCVGQFRAARNALSQVKQAVKMPGVLDVSDYMAVAIMAERERIAQWAEATADHYDAQSIVDAIGDVPANRAAEKALKAFAAAIRGTP